VASSSDLAPTATSPLANAALLMAGQILGLAVPLLTIPYLARTLGPDHWGPVITAQAFGAWLLLFFEFGFDLSATRAVARARTDAGRIVEVVNGVQSAKLVLVGSTLPLLAVAVATLPAVRTNLSLFIAAFLYAVLRGSSPLWFFQGIDNIKAAVAFDSTTRALAGLGVFVFVRSPEHGMRVLALQAALSLVSLIVLTMWLYRRVSFRGPTLAAGVATLREGFSLFASRAWISLYVQGNTLMLSAMAGATVVAFYGGAERIVRTAAMMIGPITAAYMPRVSYLHGVDRAGAEKLVRQLLGGVSLFGLTMTLAALIGAPLLVAILLGPQYQPSIALLRALSPLPMLAAINTVLGLYWALPFGHDRAFLWTIAAAGIIDVILALLLVPHWGAMGMAAAAVAAEIVVLVALGTVWWKHR
jgi:PST family polysaccharide transporter